MSSYDTVTLVVSKYYNEYYRFYRMLEHSHPAFEIMYIRKGSCIVSCTDPAAAKPKEFTLNKGYYVYIRSNVAHNLFINRDSPCRIMNIEIETAEASENNSIRALLLSDAFLQFASDDPPYLILHDDDRMYLLLSRLHEHLSEAEYSQENDSSADILLTSMLLLLEVADKYCEQKASLDQSKMYVRKAKRYIHEHYDSADEITIPKIAAYVNISPAYLQRLFRSEAQVTIVDYINRMRMRKAKHLLVKTDLPIVDISAECGFNSRQRMYQLFVEYEGISPGTYRSQNRIIEYTQRV